MQLLPSKQLYQYWNELRGERIAPRRIDIEPSQISHLLGRAFVLEQINSYSFRYRIAGSQLCENFGIDFRDTDFLAALTLNDRLGFVRQLSLLTERGAVLVASIIVSPENERSLRIPFEFLLLPLQNGDDKIDRVLGIASSANANVGDGDWRGEAKSLTCWRVQKIETLWNAVKELPDAAQEAFSGADRKKPQHQAGGTRQGRIVDKNSRRFRVYDGGAMDTPGGNS